MGRRKSDIWSNFKEVKVDGVVRGECKKSKETVVNNPERLKSHLTRCEKTDDEPTSKAPKLVQSVLRCCSNAKQEDINIQTARYFIASNTAFLQAENPEFVKLIKLLRPGTK